MASAQPVQGPERASMHHRPWSFEDLCTLFESRAHDMRHQQIAERLGRSNRSCRLTVHKIKKVLQELDVAEESGATTSTPLKEAMEQLGGDDSTRAPTCDSGDEVLSAARRAAYQRQPILPVARRWIAFGDDELVVLVSITSNASRQGCHRLYLLLVRTLSRHDLGAKAKKDCDGLAKQPSSCGRPSHSHNLRHQIQVGVTTAVFAKTLRALSAAARAQNLPRLGTSLALLDEVAVATILHNGS